jgi:hypothetical protein
MPCGKLKVLLGLFLYLEDGGDRFIQNAVEFQRTTRRYVPEDIAEVILIHCNYVSKGVTSGGKQPRGHNTEGNIIIIIIIIIKL